ncbi:hypothetical protein PENTCL1PPCAC_9547, partial [Pristionchus entomophagus]
FRRSTEMEPPEASLVIVEEWQRKSSVLVGQSEDGIVSVLNKAFNVMAAFLNKKSTDKRIRLALAHLQVERSVNLQYENIGNDSTRDLMYGLIESLQLTLSELIEGSNGTEETGVVCRISVEDWLRKSVELCIQTDDELIPVVKKTLEAIVTIRNKKSDEKSIRLALAHLEVERSHAVQYESIDKDTVRDLFFGFIECIHLTLSRLVDDSNHEKVPKEVPTESAEPLVSPPDLSYPPSIRSTDGLSTNLTFPLGLPNTYTHGYEVLKHPAILKEEVLSDEEMPELTANFMGEEQILSFDVEDILAESDVSFPPHYPNRAPILREMRSEENEKTPLKKSVDTSIVDARTNRGFLGSSSEIVFKPVKKEVIDEDIQPPLKKSNSALTEGNKSTTLVGAHTKNRLIPTPSALRKAGDGSLQYLKTSTPMEKRLCVIGVKPPVYAPNAIVRGSTVVEETKKEDGDEKGGQKREQVSRKNKNQIETPAHGLQLSPIRRKCRKFTRVVVESSSDEDSDEDAWLIVCICGQTEEDGEEMVQCDKCLVRWEHVDCIFPRTKKAPAGDYTCHVCQPRPTELTPEQAQAYQKRVKEVKERATKREEERKKAERAKRKEENLVKRASQNAHSEESTKKDYYDKTMMEDDGENEEEDDDD